MNQVNNILDNYFQSVPHEEKLYVKRIGALRPLDINLTLVGNRKFNNEGFARNQRLTASIAKQSPACYSV